jgi:hypothetical protein
MASGGDGLRGGQKSPAHSARGTRGGATRGEGAEQLEQRITNNVVVKLRRCLRRELDGVTGLALAAKGSRSVDVATRPERTYENAQVGSRGSRGRTTRTDRVE